MKLNPICPFQSTLIWLKIRFFSLLSANYEENESRGWYCALLSATFIQYALSVTGIVLLYIYYDCAINRFFITFNMILCAIVSVISIMPQVQERISRSGLLQSSVVTLYVIYLTWSALANNPNADCHSVNPEKGDSKVKSPTKCSRNSRNSQQ